MEQSVQIWRWVQVAFALIAIPTVVFNSDWSRWTEAVNGVLVVGGTLLILLHVIVRKTNSTFERGLVWPMIIFGAVVLLRNRGYAPGGLDIEPFGVLVMLGGLGTVASRRAVARERKLMEMEQESTTARRIQSSIIPEVAPDVRRISIALRYQPMTAVAGDFFDFLKAGESSLTILVADVWEHGVPAALVASILKVCFAA